MPQSRIRSLQLKSSDFKEIVEAALGAPLNITTPLSSGTALTLSGSPVQWTPITGGGSTVQGGDGITVTGGSPIGTVQTVAVDTTVARTDVAIETFSFAGTLSLNLEDTSQGADEKIWRISNTGGNFIIATRTDADGGGVSAFTMARTGTAVDNITITEPLLLTSSGTASTSTALQLQANNPTMAFNKTNATGNQGVWDITAETDGQLIFRTRTDAFGGGSTWLTVNRSGTTVGDIAFTGSRLLFNGVPVQLGSPQTGGGSVTASTGADNRIAVFTTSSNIEGDASFQWDASTASLSLFDTGDTASTVFQNDGANLRVTLPPQAAGTKGLWISRTFGSPTFPDNLTSSTFSTVMIGVGSPEFPASGEDVTVQIVDPFGGSLVVRNSFQDTEIQLNTHGTARAELNVRCDDFFDINYFDTFENTAYTVASILPPQGGPDGDIDWVSFPHSRFRWYVRRDVFTATENDLNVSTYMVTYASVPSGGTTLTGISSGADGRMHTITNVAGTGSPNANGDITCPHESGSSSAGNRFWIGAGSPNVLVIPPYHSATFIYNSEISRWLLMSKTF